MSNLQSCLSLLKSCFPDEKLPNLRYEDHCNGFISNMIRTQVGSLNLILKSSPTHPAFRQQLKVRQLYLNEMYFYEKIVPRLGIKSCPKIYKVDKDNEILLMEDLSASGYGLMKRDSKYVSAVFKEFAKFHARSLVVKQKDKDVWEEICSNVYKDLEGFNEESELTGCILEQCEKVLPFVQKS
ncbi:PREDICTED: uncharacterized protein LOC108567021 [Nicrophorus vespilloides]|uniref:Uncharacterized protein LOC108567021 n=1 Tax=Nicrophorus vespilloides TaxID=110193 RepID=A0ABM1N794_NICVS|nr:PREDICTED: uncharacterized protein LOC108567021 [Nicrophorus vespilloides]